VVGDAHGTASPRRYEDTLPEFIADELADAQAAGRIPVRCPSEEFDSLVADGERLD